MIAFKLHERLEADTFLLGDTSLCEVRLMNDSTWPWVLLVPRRANIREIYELSTAEQSQLMWESSSLGQGMMAVFRGDKLNVAALGNQVPQLHVHHIVRFRGDPAWPGPVWGARPPVAYTDEELEETRDLLAPVLATIANA